MALAIYKPKNTQIVHSTSVDFSSRPISEPVHIVQYDDRIPILAVSLYKDGQIYNVPTEASANIRWRKPDGKFVYNPAIGISEDYSILYFEITVQMVTVYGYAASIVEIECSDESVAGSGPITIIIDKNPIQHGDIESSDEYKTTKGYAEEAEKSAKAAATSEKNASTSEKNATSSAKAAKTSETNAKASEDAAASSAAEAKTSEGNAKKSEENASGYAEKAEKSAKAAKTSETNAKASEDAAASSAAEAINAAEASNNAAVNADQSATDAKSAAENAASSAEDSCNFADISKSYAIGETGIRDGEDADNSKYYYEESKKNSESAADSAKGIKNAEENAAKSAERAEEAAKKAQSIAEGYRGYFATPEDLKTNTPIGEDGYWAIVGSTNTMWIWDGNTSSWVNSSTSVSGDFLPLSGGIMTGNISIERNGYVATPAATYDGDENGMDLVMNSGGITYVGGGKSADIFRDILESDGTGGIEKSLILSAETFIGMLLGDAESNVSMIFEPDYDSDSIRLGNVANPVDERDAVNKQYVDGLVGYDTTKAFIPRGQLTESDDLHNLSLPPGIYWSTAASPPANMPEDFSSNAAIIVIFHSASIETNNRRMIFVHGLSAGESSKFYHQVYHYSAASPWRPWVEIGNFLPLSGGTMTGDISVQRGEYKATPIRTYEGDKNGIGVVLQGGGRTIISSGEAGVNLHDVLEDGESTERLYLASDKEIFLVPNCNTITKRQVATVNARDDGVSISGIAAPINDSDAVNKQYVDTTVKKYVVYGNGWITGNIPVGSSSASIANTGLPSIFDEGRLYYLKFTCKSGSTSIGTFNGVFRGDGLSDSHLLSFTIVVDSKPYVINIKKKDNNGTIVVELSDATPTCSKSISFDLFIYS